MSFSNARVKLYQLDIVRVRVPVAAGLVHGFRVDDVYHLALALEHLDSKARRRVPGNVAVSKPDLEETCVSILLLSFLDKLRSGTYARVVSDESEDDPAIGRQKDDVTTRHVDGGEVGGGGIVGA